ncbi:septum formation inhibitor Maf [Candidatus Kaiserbacteria bacterium]|nr:septum formation inhibitor Maf [Candidatus Kaiserbacteria bacterium]
MRKIILASQSPWRKKILAKTGLKFRVVVSNFEEDLGLKLSPERLAILMARGKAEAVAKKQKDAIIIGADTFIVFGKQYLGKPHTPERAREMLTMLAGKWHRIITGFVILDPKNGKRIEKSVITHVHLRKADKKEIDAYVKTGEPLQVAGGYAIQGRAGALIDKIEGDYWNIVGLPLSDLVVALRKFNIKPR